MKREKQTKKYVAYFRVSTKSQGREGLGIEGQRKSVMNFIKDKGKLIGEFTEVETGTRKKKRIEIYKAIDLAKTENAILCVAVLDRLARDVEFTSSLLNSGVEFVCVDNPTANKMSIQIMAVMAEAQADSIREAVLRGLDAKKDRMKRGDFVNKNGTKMQKIKGRYRLGNPNGWGANQKLGAIAKRQYALTNKANVQAMSIICDARASGKTFAEIAKKLNDLKYKTRNGNEFLVTTVRRLFLRCPDFSINTTLKK